MIDVIENNKPLKTMTSMSVIAYILNIQGNIHRQNKNGRKNEN